MNRSIAIAAIALAAASTAFAESPLASGSNAPFAGVKNRAEVQAELQQYKAARVNPWSTSYNQLRGFQSSKTRAQVTADYLQARAVTAAMTGEDSGSAYLSARSRSAVAPVVAGRHAL